MPWGFIVVTAAAVAFTKLVLFPFMLKHGGQKVNAFMLAGPDVVNDQVDRLASFVGPTSIYVTVPSGLLPESITVDGAPVDVDDAQNASIAAGTMPALKIDVSKPAGQIVIVTVKPSLLGRLELKFLGPESAAQLEAQGLLKRRVNTIHYGVGS